MGVFIEAEVRPFRGAPYGARWVPLVAALSLALPGRPGGCRQADSFDRLRLQDPRLEFLIVDPPARLPEQLLIDEPYFGGPSFSLPDSRGPVEWTSDFGALVLSGPESVIETFLGLLGDLFPATEGPGVTKRILDFHVVPRERGIFSDYCAHLVDVERRALSRLAVVDQFEGADPGGLQEEAELSLLARQQRRLFFKALYRTYFSRYKQVGDSRIRNDAFSLSEWHGVDFAVVPLVLAGYVYYHGLEQRVSLGDVWMRVSVEPVADWTHGEDDVDAALSLELGLRGFPLALILSTGLHDGDFGMDFIGIGTSLDAVLSAITLRQGKPDFR